jgi:hypothetical protein
MLPKEYILEQIKILKQLYLWQYLSDEEKEELRQAPNVERVSILMRTFREKYYDIMLADYETKTEDEYIDLPILDMELKTKTMNSLMRKGLITSAKAMEFIKKYGWSSIPLFGAGSAKDLYIQIYDIEEEEIDKLVKETRYTKKKC